ncbi:flagellar hook-basal body complex protein FliE [Borrelia sp. P9F1]|uniref:flagellar hook-basal body complex protein FliE n=1 Tax=Borrelia sp. P9F1 TaxID=3058374 RepID=UPI0026484BE9|nr:flagellar hook-basal body complex protein FliE [Borrelia sp. P9F1]WKC57862.1 flagellar hook-basal body complex protein FliE [Borrelia sp. P9F1]
MRVDSFFMDDNGVYLERKDPLHFKLGSTDFEIKERGLPRTFKDVFFDAISRVNDSQLDVSRMTERAIVEPDKIDVHDVVIAMAKANMNLSVTKAVVEKGVRAYQDIINIR